MCRTPCCSGNFFDMPVLRVASHSLPDCSYICCRVIPCWCEIQKTGRTKLKYSCRNIWIVTVYKWYDTNVSSTCNNVFLVELSCPYGINLQHFGDSLCFHHVLMVGIRSTLTWLIAREDSIQFGRHENFKSYISVTYSNVLLFFETEFLHHIFWPQWQWHNSKKKRNNWMSVSFLSHYRVEVAQSV